ncbi:hypothetical protein [Aeromicrobium sp.]|uniref:hypothetical protein n=1 Tax=Aeromicrobium sp. TaxID=1871063 RepID=UPI002FC6FE7F
MTDSPVPSNPPVVPIVETTAVQLTRIEGVANLIAERVSDLRGRVDGHDDRFGHTDEKIDRHDSRIQSLEEGAVADKETRIQLAKAVKDSMEARDLAAEKENRKADQAWKPIQYAGWFIGVVMVALEVYQRISTGS